MRSINPRFTYLLTYSAKTRCAQANIDAYTHCNTAIAGTAFFTDWAPPPLSATNKCRQSTEGTQEHKL